MYAFIYTHATYSNITYIYYPKMLRLSWNKEPTHDKNWNRALDVENSIKYWILSRKMSNRLIIEDNNSDNSL